MRIPRGLLFAALTLAALSALRPPAVFAQSFGEPDADAPGAPRINGPAVYGVRPGSPFFYTIPVAGDRPMVFLADYLPEQLHLDETRGRLVGRFEAADEFRFDLVVESPRARARRPFRIVVGERIALTPPLGWRTRHGGEAEARRAADAMIERGLINHGWKYVVVDDARRVPAPGRALFSAYVHGLGLRLGLGAAPEDLPRQQGALDFSLWAEQGVDLLALRAPADADGISSVSEALRRCGRDVVLAVQPPDGAERASWRETGANILDLSGATTATLESMFAVAAEAEALRLTAGPGRWLDLGPLWAGSPDGGPSPLTRAEQRAQTTLWILLAAPLWVGGDLYDLGEFEMELLTNDEALAIHQDAFGEPGRRIRGDAAGEVWARRLGDGSCAAGLFNRGAAPASVRLRLDDLGLPGLWRLHDVWTGRALGASDQGFDLEVPPGGARLVRLRSAVGREDISF